jgi:hypothetical protein
MAVDCFAEAATVDPCQSQLALAALEMSSQDSATYNVVQALKCSTNGVLLVMGLMSKAAFAALLLGSTAVAAYAASPATSSGCPTATQRAESESGNNQGLGVRQAESESGNNQGLGVRQAESESGNNQGLGVRRAESEGGNNLGLGVRQAESESGNNQSLGIRRAEAETRVAPIDPCKG